MLLRSETRAAKMVKLGKIIFDLPVKMEEG